MSDAPAEVRRTQAHQAGAGGVRAEAPAGRLLAYFEILLSLPLLLVAALVVVMGSQQAHWEGYRGGLATVTGGVLLACLSAVVLLVPALALLSGWRYRWWPQLLPLLLFASIAVLIATHWLR